ncbi:hypothetical protein KC207_00995 [Phycicoccus sp. BSK3Z-2]|uniref:Uncharacterized protein n=1 Tax=Phycicoccus avicenniae TaxID=2828860 RepID=A0A941D4C2_9MICO|nr:hypothetical protein [Phycicoccus avicenniae]MBR7741869.1 hypothetical protein [Phycicoccus avicenniae]
MTVLLRTAALVALVAFVGFGWSSLAGSDGDADIGAGLGAFLALGLASFGWATRDARTAPRPTGVVVRWLLVGVVVGVVASVLPQLRTSGLALATYVDDLRSVGVLGVVLVVVPALAAVPAGRVLRRRARGVVDQDTAPPPR